ncbi:hypothetical protein HBA53_18985 [Rhodococcus pyridinivorans]|nr:hypothetical protein [Rhodococcus sp. DMU2021]QXF83903.1 hypothetical protein HBA53_18985 [Rhodococcus pyridinivorans]
MDPDDLRAATHDLRDLADQADGARRYADRWLTPPETGGLIYFDVVERVHTARARLTALYDELGVAIDRAATAMTESARTYEDTELGTSAQFERTGPDIGR